MKQCGRWRGYWLQLPSRFRNDYFFHLSWFWSLSLSSNVFLSLFQSVHHDYAFRIPYFAHRVFQLDFLQWVVNQSVSTVCFKSSIQVQNNQPGFILSRKFSVEINRVTLEARLKYPGNNNTFILCYSVSILGAQLVNCLVIHKRSQLKSADRTRIKFYGLRNLSGVIQTIRLMSSPVYLWFRFLDDLTEDNLLCFPLRLILHPTSSLI